MFFRLPAGERRTRTYWGMFCEVVDLTVQQNVTAQLRCHVAEAGGVFEERHDGGCSGHCGGGLRRLVREHLEQQLYVSVLASWNNNCVIRLVPSFTWSGCGAWTVCNMSVNGACSHEAIASRILGSDRADRNGLRTYQTLSANYASTQHFFVHWP